MTRKNTKELYRKQESLRLLNETKDCLEKYKKTEFPEFLAEAKYLVSWRQAFLDYWNTGKLDLSMCREVTKKEMEPINKTLISWLKHKIWQNPDETFWKEELSKLPPVVIEPTTLEDEAGRWVGEEIMK